MWDIQERAAELMDLPLENLELASSSVHRRAALHNIGIPKNIFFEKHENEIEKSTMMLGN